MNGLENHSLLTLSDVLSRQDDGDILDWDTLDDDFYNNEDNLPEWAEYYEDRYIDKGSVFDLVYKKEMNVLTLHRRAYLYLLRDEWYHIRTDFFIEDGKIAYANTYISDVNKEGDDDDLWSPDDAEGLSKFTRIHQREVFKSKEFDNISIVELAAFQMLVAIPVLPVIWRGNVKSLHSFVDKTLRTNYPELIDYED